MAENKPTLESTLKSADTEEFIDIHFYRPVGYRWALFFNKLGVTPNQITIASIFIGVAAGICYYFSDIWINILGIFLLVWANSYDSADGQLARMTGQKSALGRILDGACGDFWFISIYLAIVFRLFPVWGWWILALALATGYFHSKQAAMADYYRNVHLLFLKGKSGSELDNSKVLAEKYKTLSWKKEFIVKLFETFYLNYTKGQEALSPRLQGMMKVLDEEYNGDAPEWFRTEFREKSLPLMKYTNILSFNTRAIVLFLSVLIGMPWIYFVFEITILNILLVYMIRKHENICKGFIHKLSQKSVSLHNLSE
jgi:phosphatidylserine synthase